jgi:hypothetical protein
VFSYCRFGSYEATSVTPWTVRIRYNRVAGYYGLYLSCVSSSGEDISFHVTHKDILGINICNMFSCMTLVILPATGFSALVSERLKLDPNLNEYFDRNIRVRAAKQILINLREIPQENKNCFYQILTEIATHHDFQVLFSNYS